MWDRRIFSKQRAGKNLCQKLLPEFEVSQLFVSWVFFRVYEIRVWKKNRNSHEEKHGGENRLVSVKVLNLSLFCQLGNPRAHVKEGLEQVRSFFLQTLQGLDQIPNQQVGSSSLSARATTIESREQRPPGSGAAAAFFCVTRPANECGKGLGDEVVLCRPEVVSDAGQASQCPTRIRRQSESASVPNAAPAGS